MNPVDDIVFDEKTIFRSINRDNMCFGDVYGEIMNFIAMDKDSSYRISIGSDSQTSSKTMFVSCILVHRIGKGAIGFFHKTLLKRQVKSLREKIFLETVATLQLAYMFDEEKIKRIIDNVGQGGKSRGVYFEFHIDIGKSGPTKSLINEMTGMVRGLGFTPKIKPDSYCASNYADRHTKAI